MDFDFILTHFFVVFLYSSAPLVLVISGNPSIQKRVSYKSKGVSCKSKGASAFLIRLFDFFDAM